MLHRPADAIDPARLRRVLVTKLRHHGDVLLASPVLTALKAAAPQAEVDALVYADTADMLSLHPALSQLHRVDRRWRQSSLAARLGAEWKLYAALRGRAYDLIVHLTDQGRGAWLARRLGAGASVAPDAPGKSGWWRDSFTHRYRLPANGGRHTVELNLDALRRIGIQPDEGSRALVLVPGEDAVASVDGMLAGHGVAPRGFVHLHPASRWRFKCWESRPTAALVDALEARGLRVVLTAAPDDAERSMLRDILAACRSTPVDLTGQLSLKQLAALSARARLFIGVDSAPMHIAAAMGTPVVALFGPSGEREWGPWRVPHRVVASTTHACRPCGNDGCGGGKLSECLSTLPLALVLDAADALLAD
jgi:heptosyltransferase-3